MSTTYQRPPIKVALMGLGRAMLMEHYPVFKSHPALFSITAACDIQKERRDIIAPDFPNCKMFRQFSDMLDEHDIDLVIISSCSVDHVKHAIQSLKHGYWTLLESPMALTFNDAQLLRGAAVKSKGRLMILQRGMFSPDYLLTKMTMNDHRLGDLHQIIIRKEDFIRRDDWQTVKRLGGGASFYAMPDLIAQALKMLPFPPVQMWSELKRVVSAGDAEDFAHLILKTRTPLSVDIEYNGGVLESLRGPSFILRGTNGSFAVRPGANEGKLTVLDPEVSLARRRSSVRTPPLKDMHEQVVVKEFTLSLPKGTMYGPSAFWKHVYDTVRVAAPWPLALEDAIEAIKFATLMKKTSPFGAGK